MKHEKEGKIPFSEKIDRLITHKILGFPIFLAVMFLFFRLRLRGLVHLYRIC